MKRVVADKLAVSLLGVEREEITPLFFLCSEEPGWRGMQIDDYERTLTGINVCPHWIHEVSTITLRTRKPAAESVAQ